MTTTLAISANLRKTAASGLKIKKEAVPVAFAEYMRKRQEVIDLFGKIEFDKSYDYKKAREKR
jgi:hypothetical protein